VRHILVTILSAAALVGGAANAQGASRPVLVVHDAVGATGTTGVTGGTVHLGQTNGPTVTIAADPVGLSVEYQVLAADFGTGPCPPPAFVSAIEALGAPAIRIGGDSEDQTAPYGTPPFPGVMDLPADFWSQLACLESQTHEPIVIGLNLASQMPAWAATMAAGARTAVPANLLSFELANEADIDGPSVPWYDATGLAHTLMPFSLYLQDAETTEAQLGAGAPVEGPDFATPRWISLIPQIASALSLQTIDTHFYPLNACTGRSEVSIHALLSEGASGISGAVNETIAAAAAVHLPLIISESNSVACRGFPGVSNAPASAVWGLRLIVNALSHGISEVRFHSSGSSYDPFIVNGAGVVTTRPLYLALKAAADLLPPGAQLQSLSTPRSLAGVVVLEPDGQKTYIVTNYTAHTKRVAVPAQGTVTVLNVLPQAPVIDNATASSGGGTTSVKIAPNSVAAITAGQ
jgi:hypothetical protein